MQIVYDSQHAHDYYESRLPSITVSEVVDKVFERLCLKGSPVKRIEFRSPVKANIPERPEWRGENGSYILYDNVEIREIGGKRFALACGKKRGDCPSMGYTKTIAAIELNSDNTKLEEGLISQLEGTGYDAALLASSYEGLLAIPNEELYQSVSEKLPQEFDWINVKQPSEHNEFGLVFPQGKSMTYRPACARLIADCIGFFLKEG